MHNTNGQRVCGAKCKFCAKVGGEQSRELHFKVQLIIKHACLYVYAY